MSTTPANLELEKNKLNPIATASHSSHRSQAPSTSPSVNLKLRKIPPKPGHHPVAEDSLPDEDANEEGDHESRSETSFTNEASVLGLNHIRTRSSPSPLRACNSFVTPFDGVDSVGSKSSSVVQHPAENSSEQGGFCVPFNSILVKEILRFSGLFGCSNLDFVYLNLKPGIFSPLWI